MIKKVLFVVTLFFTLVSFGQRRAAAEKYFKEYAYKKSAELYEDIYKDGNNSYEVLSRLGDCYYYNAEYDKAEVWYTKLVTEYKDEVTPEYIFRYAQALKSKGDFKASDRWMLKLNQLKKEDSRAKGLLDNLDYFVEYTNKKKTFVNINNLAINTKYSDFGGYILNNNFYFASTKPDETNKRLYKWNNQPHLKIYRGAQEFNTVDKVLDVKTAEKITDVASRYHESNAVITKDGSTMYFTRTNSQRDKLVGGENKTANLKIYKATNIDGKWGKLTELPFNNDNYSIGHPALSPDEKKLYFISDMPNGFGGTDIYEIDLLEDNIYGEPKNLGKNINTEGKEMFPFVGEDNTMFFASDGHLGLGALDIFESKKVGENYTKPVNLGAPVNGGYDDFAFVINNQRTNGFFSSNRKKGKGDDDIYSFIIYNCKEDISGVVTDVKTKEPINNVLVKLINSEGKVVEEITTGNDGVYTFKKVECEQNYVITAAKNDYKNDKKEAQTLDVNKELITANLSLESLIVEDEIVINPIYFDFDLYNIRKDAGYELENIVSVMNNNPDMVIKIESHTDSRGPNEYNKMLSDKRAKSTRDYIISRGIAAERIESAIGYGEEQLLNECDDKTQCTREAHQKNRRSYFYIVKK